MRTPHASFALAAAASLVISPFALAMDPPKLAAPVAAAVVPADKPRIDVVFCIDRSGSMGGVIETAKKKVWSIVNEIARAKPAPELRIGLIGYGEGERVIHQLDLTGDLDEVYKQLTTYRDDSQT